MDDTQLRLGAVAEVLNASGPRSDSVDGATMLKILAERRLFRVLTEGGPLVLSELISDDLLDELCLTVAPILVGGSGRRIVAGTGEVHTRMRPAHLLSDEPGLPLHPLRPVALTRERDKDSTHESVLWSACSGVARFEC